MDKKSLYIIISVIVFALAVSFVDAYIMPSYFMKIPIKIIFFLALPMSFFFIYKDDFSAFKGLFTFKKKGLLLALLLGIGVYTVIVGAFFLTRNIIDFSNVTSSLTEGMGITADNLIYVTSYVALLNSFLEEFFFRGYAFITLKKYSGRKLAYIFSSSIFAIYHVGMLVGMFSIGALALLLAGLIVGGCIFNYLNEMNGNIYPSWFVHMFANFGINTVGFILFGVI